MLGCKSITLQHLSILSAESSRVYALDAPQDLSRAASKAVGLTRFAFACSLLLAGYGPSSASGTVGLFRGRSPGSYVALRVPARVAEVRGELVGAA